MTSTEHRIVSQLLSTALPLGYTVSVFDGEEWTLRNSQDPGAIIQALATTEIDLLSFRDASGALIGWVQLIWGNGEDLISDCSANDLTDALCRAATR